MSFEKKTRLPFFNAFVFGGPKIKSIRILGDINIGELVIWPESGALLACFYNKLSSHLATDSIRQFTIYHKKNPKVKTTTRGGGSLRGISSPFLLRTYYVANTNTNTKFYFCVWNQIFK